MKAKRNSYLLIVFVLSVLLTGCFDVNREFKEIRNDVRDAVNCRLKIDTEFGAGSGLIGLAQTFISFSDDTDAEEANEILDEIDEVQVGVYHNRSRDFDPGDHDLDKVEDRLEDRDWERIVRRNSDDEYMLIMVQQNNGQYEKMLVINLDNRELVICEITGDLEKIVEKAIEDEDLHIEID